MTHLRRGRPELGPPQAEQVRKHVRESLLAGATEVRAHGLVIAVAAVTHEELLPRAPDESLEGAAARRCDEIDDSIVGEQALEC